MIVRKTTSCTSALPTSDFSSEQPLVPFAGPLLEAALVRREKRFLVWVRRDGEELCIHSNNTGAMFGLTEPGSPVLASHSSNPRRKLAYTQEAVFCSAAGCWVGVNTQMPNRLLAAAFACDRLPFCAGYTTLRTEVVREPLAIPPYHFDRGVYDKRVYNGWGKAEPDHALRFGPNIKDWPEQPALSEDLLLRITSHITDPVTTTDELIPSGETSSYRSNPLRLAEFTLSRKDPGYVGRAKDVQALDAARKTGALPAEIMAVYAALVNAGCTADPQNTNIGSAIFANKPGDGSAREQAASCQRVLGGAANFALEYATKRYRSNCINWGMLPFLTTDPDALELGAYVFVPDVRRALLEKDEEFPAYSVTPGANGWQVRAITLRLGALTDAERRILADGCLINYYKNN